MVEEFLETLDVALKFAEQEAATESISPGSSLAAFNLAIRSAADMMNDFLQTCGRYATERVVYAR